ncbi:MAG: type II secretion system F family protein [Planctomycetota bacterium]|nr:type II secretion system F family protein [Planctomycetota bacterium]
MVPAVAEPKANDAIPGAVRKFSYRARRGPEVVKGVVDAVTHGEAVRTIKRLGLVVVEVNLADAATDEGENRALDMRSLSAKVKREDVLHLCQQLSVLMKAGVPLPDSLEIFASQARSKEVAQVVRHIKDSVCEGEDLSAALARWPRVFPTILVSLMRAAEATGMMDEMFARVAKDLAKQRKTAAQVRGAMMYPAIMGAVSVVAVSVIMIFVLPKFEPLFRQQGDALPVLTKGLVALSAFIRTGYLIYLPALGALVVGATYGLHTATGRLFRDRAMMHLPILKRLFRSLYVARACGTMATLLGAGVSLLDVIRICKDVTKNACFDPIWTDMEARVQAGNDLSTAFRNSPMIPRSVSAMVTAGERSGRLPEVLQTTADFCEEELDHTIKSVTSMIEPLMIVFMGAVVGGIAAAMLLPIFNMSKGLKGL